MLIKETTIFTKRVERLLDGESYRLLQSTILMLVNFAKNERSDLTED